MVKRYIRPLTEGGQPVYLILETDYQKAIEVGETAHKAMQMSIDANQKLEAINTELVDALEGMLAAYVDKSPTCGWHPEPMHKAQTVLQKAKEMNREYVSNNSK